MAKIGILAGSGALAYEVARAAGEKNEVFVIAYSGNAGKEVKQFPHAEFSLLQINGIIRRLKEEGCKKLALIGAVTRPAASASSAPPDFIADIPSQLIAYAQEGALKQNSNSDDVLLTAFIRYLEKDEDFEVVAPEKLCPSLVAKAGLLVGEVNEQNQKDIDQAYQTALALGRLGIGQAVAISNGVTLAVEAAEGTQKMIERLADLPQALRPQSDNRAGLVMKLPRPQQDLRVDLPTIGPDTISQIAEQGLAGLVVEEKKALIYDREEIIQRAEKNHIFVLVLKSRALKPRLKKK